MTVDTEAVEEILDSLRQMQPLHLQNEIEQKRYAIIRWEREIAGYSETIARTIRQCRDQQALIDVALQAMGESNWADHIAGEFEQVAQHPRVASVRLGLSADGEHRAILITTTPDLRLTRGDTGDSRWLGAFEITLNVAQSEIRMRNLNTRRAGRDHPHVVDNLPCFGGHSSSFMELLANGDLYVLFELLIQYIETLNLEDEYGRYGSYWFGVTDEELGMPAPDSTLAVAA